MQGRRGSVLTLVLMRHSKAVASDGQGDHARPLQPGRGIAEAEAAGTALRRLGPAPFALVSDARRTRETFEHVAACFAEPVGHRFVPALYGASPAAILAELDSAPAAADRLLVVGHNPGIGDLARKLARHGEPKALGALAAHFPTSAFAVLTFAAPHWSGLDREGRLESFFTIDARAA